jgi:predicted nucleic acid-binding protein
MVLRNKLEVEAVLGMIGACDVGTVLLISSEALIYEMEQNVNEIRKEHAQAVLAKASLVVMIEPTVEQRAEVFVKRGIKPMDAVHVALAEAARADYFCSCDDRLLRKLKRMRDLQVKTATSLELVEELEL